jgi:hypothetical protein
MYITKADWMLSSSQHDSLSITLTMTGISTGEQAKIHPMKVGQQSIQQSFMSRSSTLLEDRNPSWNSEGVLVSQPRPCCWSSIVSKTTHDLGRLRDRAPMPSEPSARGHGVRSTVVGPRVTAIETAFRGMRPVVLRSCERLSLCLARTNA